MDKAQNPPSVHTSANEREPRPARKRLHIRRKRKTDVAETGEGSADRYGEVLLFEQIWDCPFIFSIRSSYYADDPDARALLNSIGADPDVILGP
jgi:hypothetical protein